MGSRLGHKSTAIKTRQSGQGWGYGKRRSLGKDHKGKARRPDQWAKVL